MEPLAAACCRDLLDRMLCQIHAHLPPLVTNEKTKSRDSVSILPLERLPVLSELVRLHVETESLYASACDPDAPPVALQGEPEAT